jgi:hypothetical protein
MSEVDILGIDLGTTNSAITRSVRLIALQRDDSFIGSMLRGSCYAIVLAITLCDRLSEI